MKYEDLKESFKFKTQEGKSELTFTADKKSKHIWTVSEESSDMSSDWDCEDMLGHFNSGTWVIQDDEETEQISVVQEQAEQTQEVKTLRDEFAMKVLPSIYTVTFLEAQEGSGLLIYENWRYGLALDAYMMADAMLQARKESL